VWWLILTYNVDLRKNYCTLTSMKKKLSVLTVENIKFTVFWNMTICSLVMTVNNVVEYIASTCSILLWNSGTILPDVNVTSKETQDLIFMIDHKLLHSELLITDLKVLTFAWSVGILIKTKIKALGGALKAVLVSFGLRRFLNYVKCSKTEWNLVNGKQKVSLHTTISKLNSTLVCTVNDKLW